jgi:hypothetical protein
MFLVAAASPSPVAHRQANADPVPVTARATGSRATLRLGGTVTSGRIDAGEPNEELEVGLAGAEPAPPDTPYRPHEAAAGRSGSAGSAARSSAPAPFTIFRNSVTEPKRTKAIMEPTLANATNVVLATGNTWARLSSDDGLTFPDSLTLDPAANPPPGDDVCCDQVAYTVHHNSHTLILWLLQNDCRGTKCGGDDPAGQNALTLRMFRSPSDLLAGRSCDFTFTPSSLDLEQSYFDFNKLSATKRFLYVVTDVRTLKHESGGAEIIRIALDDLDDGNCLVTYSGWNVKDDSLAPVQNAGSTMFLAAHAHDVVEGDQLRIYSLPDDSTKLEHKDRNVNNFADLTDGAGTCKSPDGDDPCARFGEVEMVGFRSGSTIGWLWTAPQDKDFEFPQVRVAVFDTAKQKRVTEHTIWNDDFAWTYPAVGVDARGDVGVILYSMGGGAYPAAQAFIRPDPRDWDGIEMHSVVASDTSFADSDSWGDYASVQPFDGCTNTFLGSAWSVRTSGKRGRKTVAENRAVWFGDPAAGCADMAVTSALAFPPTLALGDDLSVTAVTKNVGSGREDATTTTRYYLSKDSVKSGDDLRLDMATDVPSLSAGGQFAATPSRPAVVSHVSAGSYRVIVCANDESPAPELTTANNCFTGPQTIVVTKK